MDLRHLRYFICVAEEMHFGRAASRLGISQPPLSQQIRALETELGVRLFDRSSRRVSLTTAGEMFLPEARATLAQADLAAQTARRAHAGELGQLRLGFTTSGPFVDAVAGALYAFRRACPNVEFSLAELGRDEQITRLEAGLLDFGIVRGPTSPALPEGLSSTLILEEPVMVAMRADHPLASQQNEITLSMLANEPFVLYNDIIGAGFNEHFTTLCRNAGFSPRIAQEAGSLATLLGLVAAGFGLTILTRSLTRLHLENVIYCPLAEASALSGLWLIKGSNPSPAARSFLDCLLHTINASDSTD